MTDNEIIKALECCICSTSRNDCEDLNCPACKEIGCYFMDRSTEDYPDSLIQEIGKSALDLINHHKSELEIKTMDVNSLTSERDALQEMVVEQNKRIKTLSTEVDILIRKNETLKDEKSELQAEIERLNSFIKEANEYFSEGDFANGIAIIIRLAKEMEGENNV